jgi:hypothetical protein
MAITVSVCHRQHCTKTVRWLFIYVSLGVSPKFTSTSLRPERTEPRPRRSPPRREDILRVHESPAPRTFLSRLGVGSFDVFEDCSDMSEDLLIAIGLIFLELEPMFTQDNAVQVRS